MDLSKLKELLTECLELSSRIEDEISSASSAAYDAKSRADDACDYASEARDYADNAESAVDEAQRLHNDLRGYLEEMEELFEGESVAITDVPTLIRRYGEKVKALREKRISPDEIAKRLSISPVIVNIILEQQEAA